MSSSGGGGSGYVPNKLRGVMGGNNNDSGAGGGGAYKSRLKRGKSKPWRVDAASWKQELQERKAVYDNFALPESEEEEKKMVDGDNVNHNDEGDSNDHDDNQFAPQQPQTPTSPEDRIEVVLTASTTASTTTMMTQKTKTTESRTSSTKPTAEAPSHDATPLSSPRATSSPASGPRQPNDSPASPLKDYFTPRSYLDRFNASFGVSSSPKSPTGPPSPERASVVMVASASSSPPDARRVSSFPDDDELMTSRSSTDSQDSSCEVHIGRSNDTLIHSNNNNGPRIMSAEEVSTFGFLMRQEKVLMQNERERLLQEKEEERLREEMRKHAAASLALKQQKQKSKTISEPPAIQASLSVDDYDDDGILASRSPMHSPTTAITNYQSAFAQNDDDSDGSDSDDGSGDVDSDASVGSLETERPAPAQRSESDWSIRPVPTDEEEEKDDDDNQDDDIEDDVQSLVASALSAIERATTMNDDDDASVRSELMFSALNAIETAAYITHHPEEAKSLPPSPVRSSPLRHGSDSPSKNVTPSKQQQLHSNEEMSLPALATPEKPAATHLSTPTKPQATDEIESNDSIDPNSIITEKAPVNPDPLQKARKGLLVNDLGRGWHKSPSQQEEEVIETVSTGKKKVVLDNKQIEEALSSVAMRLPLSPAREEKPGDVGDNAEATGESVEQEEGQGNLKEKAETNKLDPPSESTADVATGDQQSSPVEDAPHKTKNPAKKDVHGSSKKLILGDLTTRLKTVFTGNHHTIETAGNPELRKPPPTPVVTDSRSSGPSLLTELNAKVSSMCTSHHHVVEAPSVETRKEEVKGDPTAETVYEKEKGVWIPITPLASLEPQQKGEFGDTKPADSSVATTEEPQDDVRDQQDATGVVPEEPLPDVDDTVAEDNTPSTSDDAKISDAVDGNEPASEANDGSDSMLKNVFDTLRSSDAPIAPDSTIRNSNVADVEQTQDSGDDIGHSLPVHEVGQGNEDADTSFSESVEEKQMATKAVSLMTGDLSSSLALDSSGKGSLASDDTFELPKGDAVEPREMEIPSEEEISEAFARPDLSSTVAKTPADVEKNSEQNIENESSNLERPEADPATNVTTSVPEEEQGADTSLISSTDVQSLQLDVPEESPASTKDEAAHQEEPTTPCPPPQTGPSDQPQEVSKPLVDSAPEVKDLQEPKKVVESEQSVSEKDNSEREAALESGNAQAIDADKKSAEGSNTDNVDSTAPPAVAQDEPENDTSAVPDQQKALPPLQVETADVASPSMDTRKANNAESAKAKKWKDRLANKKASKRTPKSVDTDDTAIPANKETMAAPPSSSTDSTEESLPQEQPTLIQGLPPNKTKKWKDRLAKKRGRKSFGGKGEDQDHVESPIAPEKKVSIARKVSDITVPADEELLLSPLSQGKGTEEFGSPKTGSSIKSKKWKDRLARRRSKGSAANADEKPEASEMNNVDMTGRTIVTIPSGDDEDTVPKPPLQIPELNENKEEPRPEATEASENDTKQETEIPTTSDKQNPTRLVENDDISEPTQTTTSESVTLLGSTHDVKDPADDSANKDAPNPVSTAAVAVQDKPNAEKIARLRNSFQAFDAILKDRPSLPTDDESVWTEVTIGQETAVQDVEGTHADDVSYMEFTVDESVQDSYIDETIVSDFEPNQSTPDAKKVPSMTSPSPFMTNLLSSRLFQDVAPQFPAAKQNMNLGDHFEESNKKFPTITVDAIADDDMTQITMDHDLNEDEDDDHPGPPLHIGGMQIDASPDKEEAAEKLAPLERPPMVRVPSAKSRSSHKSRKSTGGASVSSQFSSETSKQRIAEILRKDVWSRDITVVQAGMEELSKQAGNGRKYRTHIVRCGGIMAITRTMEMNSDNADVQVPCCEILEKLADDPESQSTICEMEGISLIVQCMQEYSDSVKVQEAACSALASICRREESEDVKESMKEANGAVFTLLTSMTRFADNPRVQAKAFGAIANLCMESRERLSELSEAGGIMTMTLALQKPWENKHEQHEAISSLSILLRGITELNAKPSPKKSRGSKVFDTSGDDSSLSDMSNNSDDDKDSRSAGEEVPRAVEAKQEKQDGVTTRTSMETESVSTKAENQKDGEEMEEAEMPKPEDHEVNTSTENADESASFATAENGESPTNKKPEAPSKDKAITSTSFESLESLEAIPSTNTTGHEGQDGEENSNTDIPASKDGKDDGKDEQCIVQ